MRVRVAKRDPAVTIPGARHKFRPSRASRYRSGAIGSNYGSAGNGNSAFTGDDPVALDAVRPFG